MLSLSSQILDFDKSYIYIIYIIFFRAIEVYDQLNGQKTLSDVYAAQRSQPGGNHLGGPPRYEHIILFWLKCHQVSEIRIL